MVNSNDTPDGLYAWNKDRNNKLLNSVQGDATVKYSVTFSQLYSAIGQVPISLPADAGMQTSMRPSRWWLRVISLGQCPCM